MQQPTLLLLPAEAPAIPSTPDNEILDDTNLSTQVTQAVFASPRDYSYRPSLPLTPCGRALGRPINAL